MDCSDRITSCCYTLQLVKTDKQGHKVKLSHATFKIKDSAGNYLKQKVGLFYKNIGRLEACLDLTEWNASDVVNRLFEVEKKQYKKDESYLMALYTYLYNVFVKRKKENKKERK